MKRKEIFFDKERSYGLTKDKAGKYYLEVVCGTIGMEFLIIMLTEDEMLAYQREGKTYLDDLSWEICKNKRQYEDRFIDE